MSEQNTTSLTELRQTKTTQAQNTEIGFNNLAGFELMQRAATTLSKSTLVPQQYQNNLSNCIVALNMSHRLGADPLMVMQNLVIVHGKPSWSAKFLIATVNSCGRFSALRFEFSGEPNIDDWGCVAWAYEKSTGEKLHGPKITIKLAKDEGWYGKNGSKWKTMPEKMMQYRAGAWWCDVYAPELSMGLRTEDEERDIIDIDLQGNILSPENEETTESLKKRTKRKIIPTETETKQEEIPISEFKESVVNPIPVAKSSFKDEWMNSEL